MKIIKQIINYFQPKFKNTPDNIVDLRKNQIFVFGSNLSGIHGAGAAQLAYSKFGAIYGLGEGKQGDTYALPTKDKALRTLSLLAIEKHVNKFIVFAIKNPNYDFLVTQIGCGLAGYNIKDIAPMFRLASDVKNIYLPKEFRNDIKRRN